MPSRGLRPVLAGALLVTVLLPLPKPGAAADTKTPTLPDSAYSKLAEQSTEVLRASLKGEVRPRTASRAATQAVMLAAFAQQNLAGEDGAKRVAVRDSALEITEKIRKKDFEAALKQADGLAALRADPKAKKEAVALEAKASTKELMNQFRTPKEGGLGIEERFDTLGRSPDETLPAKELSDVLLLDAYRSAVTAELMRGQKPKADVEDWQKFCDKMRQQSLDLAGAVAAKEGKTAYKALNTLNDTCDKCHQQFRKD